MLGIQVAQSTVAKYMVPRFRRPPSQSWKTFLRNHAAGIASIDLFVVPTAFFKLLYALVILRHERRRLIGFGVTAYPSAEWIARQVTETYNILWRKPRNLALVRGFPQLRGQPENDRLDVFCFHSADFSLRRSDPDPLSYDFRH